MNLELLTSVLQNNGYLGDATVVGIELTKFETNGISSEFYKAELHYSSDDHSLPERMVVKRPSIGDRGQGEADVYELVFRGAKGLPLMDYFGVVDEAADSPLSFLFEDLSESHQQTPWPIIPGLLDCEQAVVALASIHGHWWGRTESIEAPTPQVVSHQDAKHLATFLPEFVDFVSEYLSPARITHYETIFSNLDTLLAQRLTANNTTLLHTDSHFWNFLYPKEPQRNDCVIFDWPLWRTGLAGWDLAYMIALHLYPEHRHRFETTLLDSYWRGLQECNVSYDREDVQLDYRIGVIFGLLMPVMEFTWKIPPLDWMPKLEKAFSAFEDLNCQDLLKTA